MANRIFKSKENKTKQVISSNQDSSDSMPYQMNFILDPKMIFLIADTVLTTSS